MGYLSFANSRVSLRIFSVGTFIQATFVWGLQLQHFRSGEFDLGILAMQLSCSRKDVHSTSDDSDSSLATVSRVLSFDISRLRPFVYQH